MQYSVTVRFETIVDVEADNEQEAEEKARREAAGHVGYSELDAIEIKVFP
jgi:hypothetical protein